MERKTAWIILNMLNGIGPACASKLMSVYKDPRKIFDARPDEIKNLLTHQAAESIRNWKNIKWEQEIERVEKLGIKIFTMEEPGYPESLKQIPDPPIALYVKGNIPNNAIFIAVVGTRNPSFYGATMAEKFSSELASYGFCIVSGLARGIDSIAHKAALKAKRQTVAVLGSGLEKIYPEENKKLADDISRSGAVISEFPLDTPPEKFNFPRRNRIISGLSRAVLVIEAGLRSGALITAHHAAEQNKDVFVLPSDANRITGRGNNQLIKEGAALIESVEEIIKEMNLEMVAEISSRQKIENKMEEDLTEEEKLVYNVIKGKKIGFEQIQAETRSKPEHLMRILTGLEIKGLISSNPGYVYRDKKLSE
ncbi:MAG: DNA-processing protein DprA [Candidatus Omnitrophica bacterium]|nr:DNA-processing protein DprA [Candidatus Omnitrophota bacterium]MCM8827998.1 DNA-processing protein DprA [Candidatus Omnitrophota bacterium]